VCRSTFIGVYIGECGGAFLQAQGEKHVCRHCYSPRSNFLHALIHTCRHTVAETCRYMLTHMSIYINNIYINIYINNIYIHVVTGPHSFFYLCTFAQKCIYKLACIKHAYIHEYVNAHMYIYIYISIHTINFVSRFTSKYNTRYDAGTEIYSL
jgi:hypothetical protein